VLESFGPVVAFFGIIGISIFVMFLAFQPRWVDKGKLAAYNWSVLFMVAMICTAWALNAEQIFTGALEKYLMLFKWVGIFSIESVFLGVFLLLRNFWVFKGPKLGAR
jgi:hypothetical protein